MLDVFNFRQRKSLNSFTSPGSRCKCVILGAAVVDKYNVDQFEDSVEFRFVTIF